MMEWKCFSYGDLDRDRLYEIMALRQKVFIIEQNCNYLDADGLDEKSDHFCGYENGELVAYLRIVHPGVVYKEVAIGRVLAAKSIRGKGAGIELMEKAMEAVEKRFGTTTIRLSAQSYLKKFYEDLGYVPTGKEYFEDNIPHMEMLRE